MADRLEYVRYPIFINRHSVAVIHVWTRTISPIPFCQSSAVRQFVAQLENHWTPAFLMALRAAITEALQRHDDNFGTGFAEVKL